MGNAKVGKTVMNAQRSVPETITSFFLYLSLTVFLLIIGENGYLDIVVIKYSAFLWIAGGYCILMLLLGLEMLVMGDLKPVTIKKLFKNLSLVQRLLGIFLLCTIISSAVSPYAKDTILGLERKEGLLTIIIYIMCFFFVSEFYKPSRGHIYAFGTSMTVFCILSLTQLASFNPLNLYTAGYSYYDANIAYSGAYIGTAGNIDIASAILCIAIPVFGVSAIRLKEKLRFFLLIPLALCVSVLVLINVQAGLVGILAGVTITIPVALSINKKSKIITLIAIAALLTIGIVIVRIYDFGGSGTLFEVHELLNGRFGDEYGSGRIYIWKNVLELVPDRLLFGGGPDTLSLREPITFERYDENLDLMIYSAVDAAHNEYLNILVNQGLLAFITYITAIMISLIGWLKSSGSAAAISGAALICYGIQAFFCISMCINALFFWIAWGVLVKSIKHGKESLVHK